MAEASSARRGHLVNPEAGRRALKALNIDRIMQDRAVDQMRIDAVRAHLGDYIRIAIEDLSSRHNAVAALQLAAGLDLPETCIERLAWFCRTGNQSTRQIWHLIPNIAELEVMAAELNPIG